MADSPLQESQQRSEYPEAIFFLSARAAKMWSLRRSLKKPKGLPQMRLSCANLGQPSAWLLTADQGSFTEFDAGMRFTKNPIDFPRL